MKLMRGSHVGSALTFLSVRPHAYVGAALLALAALQTALRSTPWIGRDPDLALLGGLTLLLQCVAFWYVPSFAKREIVLKPIAAWSGPLLFPLALVLSYVSFDLWTLAAGIGLLAFAIVLAASVVAGPKWRSGIPFWRADSPHRAGDRAAMLAFASAIAWWGLALPLRLARPFGPDLAWIVGLACFATGGLAHLLPRARGVPASAWTLLGALAIVHVAAVATALDRAPRAALPLAVVALGFAILPLGGKAAGPRLREASPLLLAALACAILAVVRPAALAPALASAILGLALLALPVVFNQRPDGRFVVPAALAATASAASDALLRAGLPGAILFAISLLLALAALAPLRRPRRDCAVDRIPS